MVVVVVRQQSQRSEYQFSKLNLNLTRKYFRINKFRFFEKVLRQITIWIVGTKINKEIYKVHDYSGAYAYYFDKMFQGLLLFWDLCLSQNLE